MGTGNKWAYETCLIKLQAVLSRTNQSVSRKSLFHGTWEIEIDNFCYGILDGESMLPVARLGSIWSTIYQWTVLMNAQKQIILLFCYRQDGYTLSFVIFGKSDVFLH